MKDYDEIEAVGFIKNTNPDLATLKDDDILLVIDTIFEYDEKCGEDADDDQLSPEAVAAYVVKQMKNDVEFTIPLEMILPIVKAEYAYEAYLWDSNE